jgi:hypothetical protein
MPFAFSFLEGAFLPNYCHFLLLYSKNPNCGYIQGVIMTKKNLEGGVLSKNEKARS